MTLEEAIKHAEEKAEELRNEAEHYEIAGVNVYGCEECAKEHEQLAEWLRDYKRLKEQESCDVPDANVGNIDCISREDALMALTGEWTESKDELIPKFIRRIKRLPSVTPKDDRQELIERINK